MRNALKKYPLVAGSVASPVSDFVKLCHNIAEFHPFLPGRKAGPTAFIAGANMGVRRSLFEEVKGFPNVHPLAPDTHFILKAREAGYQIHLFQTLLYTTIIVQTFQIFSDTPLITHPKRFFFATDTGCFCTPFILRSPILFLSQLRYCL
jgi:hypothetical protein